MERPFLTSIFLVLGIIEFSFPLVVDSVLEKNELKLISLPSSIVAHPLPPLPPPSKLVHHSKKNKTEKSSLSHHNQHKVQHEDHNQKNFTKKSSHSHQNQNSEHIEHHIEKNVTEKSSTSHQNQHPMNLGKKVGLLFAGIAVVFQVNVIGFLVYKRWEISEIKDRHENCSA